MRERNSANTGEEKPGRFFAAKQLFLFAVMTVAVLLVDFLLLCGISAAELMNNHAWDGDNSQHSYVRNASPKTKTAPGASPMAKPPRKRASSRTLTQQGAGAPC